jgi:hypothetical protein
MYEFHLPYGGILVDDSTEHSHVHMGLVAHSIKEANALRRELNYRAELREKNSTGSGSPESEPGLEGAIGKTVGLSYERPEGV